MDLSGDWLSGGMFAGGVALMTLVLMRRWLGYQRRNRRRGSRNRSSNVTQKRTWKGAKSSSKSTVKV